MKIISVVMTPVTAPLLCPVSAECAKHMIFISLFILHNSPVKGCNYSHVVDKEAGAQGGQITQPATVGVPSGDAPGGPHAGQPSSAAAAHPPLATAWHGASLPLCVN